MFAQLVQNFVHFEGGGQRVNQHRGLDGTIWLGQPGLREHKNVVPKPGFEVALELG